MVLKKEMAQESVQLEKKIKRLENKVKKLKAAVEEDKEMGEYRIKTLIREREEKEELRNKIFELEQQLDAQETKGPLFSVFNACKAPACSSAL